jgi:hypothetical protein
VSLAGVAARPVERWAATAVVFGFVACLLVTACEQWLGRWPILASIAVWAVAGVVFGIAIFQRLWRSRRPAPVRGRAAAGPNPWTRWALRQLPRLLQDRLALRRTAWPVLILSGPILALAIWPASHVGLLGVSIVLLLFFSIPVAELVVLIVGVLREANESVVAVSKLAVAIAMWIGFAAATSFEFHWPAPGSSYFSTAAQINATLLVAGVIGAAPRAWQASVRVRFTWALTAPTVTVIGLAASIGGSVAKLPAHQFTTAALFVLSVSPVAPFVMTLLIAAYGQVIEASRVQATYSADQE